MSETNTKPRRGPMGHGHGMGPGEKPKDFKNSIKKLLAYIGKYKIGILFVAIFAIICFTACTYILTFRAFAFTIAFFVCIASFNTAVLIASAA